MTKPTRGHGLLENFLAKKRASMADKLIRDDLRKGRILDIGCGSVPLFLVSVKFAEKHGIDQLAPAREIPGINYLTFSAGREQRLPYDNGHFSVVTLLAVIEHLEPDDIAAMLREIHRTLKPGGQIVLTTPASWSDSLLRIMAKAHLVSREEIDEHKDTFNRGKIRTLLKKTGFSQVKTGYFEIGLNLWAQATK